MFKLPEKGVSNTGVPIVYGVSRAMYTINKGNLLRDASIRDAIRSIAESTMKRLRSISPSKARRSTLPSTWTEVDGPSQ